MRWVRSNSFSREGEIAIAKRIEAGRNEMIGGLCESPLTFRAIISWHERLKVGDMLLRDIVDLEAMQAEQNGPEGVPAEGEDGEENSEDETDDAEDAEEVDGAEGEGSGLSLSALEEKAEA